MRGRVIAILLATALGGTPIGAPLVGWVADRFGPRWALGAGALAGFGAALLGVRHLMTHRAPFALVDDEPTSPGVLADPRPSA